MSISLPNLHTTIKFVHEYSTVLTAVKNTTKMNANEVNVEHFNFDV